MELNRRSIRMLSLLGHRGTFSQTMVDMKENGYDIAVLAADLADLTGLTNYKKLYPESFFDIGIAEQNMIGIAAGLSRYGMIPYVTTYANFLTMRAYEQIRMNLGYMKHNVKLVGTGAGLSMGMSGNSHFGLEDISLMRSIPNMVVISPSDCLETYKALYAAAEYDGPVYLRLSGPLNHPIINSQDYEFKIGKSIELKKGTDVAIIATGPIIKECQEAIKLLESNGISAELVNMHTVKPVDRSMVNECAKNFKLIVTVEEHSIIGGLGSAVAEVLAEEVQSCPLYRIGLPDRFCVAGSYEYLLNEYGMTSKKIYEQIIKRYSKTISYN